MLRIVCVVCVGTDNRKTEFALALKCIVLLIEIGDLCIFLLAIFLYHSLKVTVDKLAATTFIQIDSIRGFEA